MKIVNFRDFGGGAAGRDAHVVGGQLFRCGQPGPLGTTPFKELEDRNFAAVADLRFPDEISQATFPWRDPQRPRMVLMEDADKGHAPHHAFFTAPLGDVGDVHRLYSDFYAGLPADPRYRSLIGRALATFAKVDGPVLVHCSAGKDRTGFMCALLLRILGADDTTIVADYMISNSAGAKAALRPEIERRFSARGRPLPEDAILEAILGVDPSYLESSFAAIARLSGSTEAYLDEIGVDRECRASLQARFLA